VIFNIVTLPYVTFDALLSATINPDDDVTPEVAAALVAAVDDEVYPDVLKDPDPI
jgi:hypothetical protein